MLLNPRVIWEHPLLVLGFFIVPIPLKAVMITALARGRSARRRASPCAPVSDSRSAGG
ncbi:MAG: Inner membrane protein, KefB/KefC family [uncultured Caballeronia sp.]|nr:MAG: Inner membrane protein, KefB/KefC family [uncultured Caballeronia sp.]